MNVFISQFLQHICTYINIHQTDFDYITELVRYILTTYSVDFFYKTTTAIPKLHSQRPEVCLWQDPVRGDTLLITLSKNIHYEVLTLFLDNLVNAFHLPANMKLFPILTSYTPLLEYLVEENKLGLSAITSMWQKKHPH